MKRSSAKSNEKLKEFRKEKFKGLSIHSHEIKNPLTNSEISKKLKKSYIPKIHKFSSISNNLLASEKEKLNNDYSISSIKPESMNEESASEKHISAIFGSLQETKNYTNFGNANSQFSNKKVKNGFEIDINELF